MSIKDEIIQWIAEQLEARGHGARGELADHLGLKPGMITRMLNKDPSKETRVIRADELVKISEFFGAPPPGIADTMMEIDGEIVRRYHSLDEKKRAQLIGYLDSLIEKE
ncbi:XRE family transcriptional regulator [Brucella anthropi]|uniref:XRE family transcriptional regulator n=1 Tax=Brucella anthropi TaxID=529 RepID=UPI001E292521|nr:XRE family transcriptional regulator [Brucella anthropi]UGQ22180.1 XRE family transcriptional regulator [Brucella anthropi]